MVLVAFILLQLADTMYNGYYDARAQLEIENMVGERYAYMTTFDPFQKKMFYYNMKTGVLSESDGIGDRVILDTLNYKFLGLSVINYYPPNNSIYIVDGGLGRVHRYDLTTRDLIRLDISYPMRAFFGFSAVMQDNHVISIMGGSGEFMQRNQIIIFNRHTQKEWLELDNIRDKQWDPSFHSLGLYRHWPSLEFYYFKYSYDAINIYRYRTVSEGGVQFIEWNLYKNIELTSKLSTLQINGFTNYSQVGSYMNISGNHLYDFENNVVYRWQPRGEFSDRGVVAIRATSHKADSISYIYVVSNDSIPFINQYKWDTISLEEFEQGTFEIISKGGFNLGKNALVWLGLLIFSMGMFFSLKRRRSQSTKRELHIELDNHCAKINYAGKIHLFYESEELNFWEKINELKERNLNTIELELFDELLFSDYVHKPQVTTKRNALIDKINNDLGFRFANLVQSKHDKRRKLVVLDMKE